MTLLAVLNPVANANTGRIKFVAGDPIGGGSLSGVITPAGFTGWVLANGARLSNSGIYANLYTMLSTKFGLAGTLPNLLDGVNPIPKGASSFTTVGASGGEITHVLTLAEYPNHYHQSYDNNGSPRGNNLDGYANWDGWPSGNYPGLTRTTSSAGGGGSHPNMPPYLVGGFYLVKL